MQPSAGRRQETGKKSCCGGRQELEANLTGGGEYMYSPLTGVGDVLDEEMPRDEQKRHVFGIKL